MGAFQTELSPVEITIDVSYGEGFLPQLSIPHTARVAALIYKVALLTDIPVEACHLFFGGDELALGDPLDMAGLEDGARLELHPSDEPNEIKGFLCVVQAMTSAQTPAACQAAWEQAAEGAYEGLDNMMDAVAHRRRTLQAQEQMEAARARERACDDEVDRLQEQLRQAEVKRTAAREATAQAEAHHVDEAEQELDNKIAARTRNRLRCDARPA